MTTDLSLGGGILYLKEDYSTGSFEDFGYCHSFRLKIDIQEQYDDRYMADSSGRLIRVPQVTGRVTSVVGSGAFTCESMTRKNLQKLWMRGTDSSLGTELFEGFDLVPLVRALKFHSVPATGPTYCLVLPSVKLSAESEIPFQFHDDWIAIDFTYEVLYSENALPSLRVQQEGESLPGFCI